LPPLYEVALSVQGGSRSSQYAVNFIAGMALLVLPEATTQSEPPGVPYMESLNLPCCLEGGAFQ
jgi:hypothetical protein